MAFIFRRGRQDEQETELVLTSVVDEPTPLSAIESPTNVDGNIEAPRNFLPERRPSFLDRLTKSRSPERTPPPDVLPPLAPVILRGYRPLTKHRLLDQDLAENIRSLATPRNQLYDDWELVYSLEQHGISLKTLYRNCDPEYQLEKFRNTVKETGYADNIVRLATAHTGRKSDYRRHHSYVMVIKDDKNNKFGCYLNEHLRAREEQRWYGNGECFLWKLEKFDPELLSHSNSKDEILDSGKENQNSKNTDPSKENQHSKNIGEIKDKSLLDDSKKTNLKLEKKPRKEVQTRFKAFVHTNLNSNIIYSNNDCISIGSSNGRNGLWIDKSMYNGVSYPCDTFGNEVLNGDSGVGKFKIMGLEVWRIGALIDRAR